MDTIKVPVKGYLRKVALEYKKDRIITRFPFNRDLNEWVKTMEGGKWDRKVWSIKNTPRNKFQIDYLQGKNPYAVFDLPLVDFTPNRKEMRPHQCLMTSHAITRHADIWAAEMGLGKSLSMIELFEWIKDNEGLEDHQAWYIGPRAGVNAVGRELDKWESRVRPIMMTYEKLVSTLKTWDGDLAPKVVIFDESSKIKTPNSQRSEAALTLANAVRDDWVGEGYIVEMTGSPAPKSPLDWWNQCEVACPGFIKEGSVKSLRSRLSIIEYRESIQGGKYPHQVAWLDNEKKCAKCGEDEEAHFELDHNHEPSINEVAKLGERIEGLVLVMYKKDILDLPEKMYQTIRIKPTPDLLRGAKMIKDNTVKAVTALTRLRELSDGFNYGTKKIGEKPCEDCVEGKIIQYIPTSEIEVDKPQDTEYEKKEIDCDVCGGTCMVDEFEQVTYTVDSPKDDVLVDILAEHHEESERLVIWGGFTASIDRIVEICHEHGWCTLRIDGRGIQAMSAFGEMMDQDELISAMDASDPRFDALKEKLPPVAVVGHPQAAGMAYTFTGSNTAVYYSNSFSGEARIQSEDRVHRMGMDQNKGCNIIDLILLKTDQLVLDNLLNKRRLQDLTMEEIREYDAV